MSISNRHNNTTIVAGALSLVILFYILFGTVLCFIFGGVINKYAFPCAIVISVITVLKLFGIDRRNLRTIVYTLIAIVISTLLCSWLTDQSFDGNAYHGEIIGHLLDGWNPLTEPVVSSTPWVHGYAKGMEMAEASVAAFTGNMESGKVVNIMLIGAALLLMCSSLREAFPKLSNKKIWITTLLFGANPVLVTQIFTFYNDYALYCCLLIAAAGMLYIYRIGWSWMWGSIAFVATAISMVTKFTHGFYLGVEWGAFLLLLLLSRKSKTVFIKSVFVAIVSAVFGLCLLGYHPYITNTQRFGHPLYPLMGDVTEDIMIDNTPKIFKSSGRVANFAKSICMIKRVTYDQRYGGFGPFMAPLLFLSLVLLVLAWRRWQVIYIFMVILGSCFFFEQTWWARYIPFLWSIIPLSVITSMLCSDQRFRYARGIIYTFVSLTLPICAVDAVWLKIEATMYRQALYSGARQSGIVNVVIEPDDVHVRRRLDEAGLKYQIVPRCKIDTSRSLFLTNDGFRGDVIELSPDAFRKIMSHGLRYKLMRMNERTLDFYDETRPCD